MRVGAAVQTLQRERLGLDRVAMGRGPMGRVAMAEIDGRLK